MVAQDAACPNPSRDTAMGCRVYCKTGREHGSLVSMAALYFQTAVPEISEGHVCAAKVRRDRNKAVLAMLR